MVSPIRNNPYTPKLHKQFFAEFVETVQYAGGTTPHMLMIVESARRQSKVEEQLWWAGCYAFVYNYATAEVIYNNWRPDQKWGYKDILYWLEQNKSGIKMRKERKAVFALPKLAECICSYRDYMHTLQDRRWFTQGGYNDAFEDVCANVKYMGRYIVIRWIEVIRRLYQLDLEMPDLRNRDGEHPRKALALMYPEFEKVLMGGNSNEEIEQVDIITMICKIMLEQHNIYADFYTLQSLLCEYKQSVLGKRQYPGKSIDSELVYYKKVNDFWGSKYADKSIMYDVRKTIFPKEVLGEISGWDGVRKPLESVLVDFGYTWSDFKYVYPRTTDFSNPYRRSL
jgi:hypothetical protein